MKVYKLVLVLLLVAALLMGCTPTEQQDPDPKPDPQPTESDKHLITDASGNYGGSQNVELYGEGAPLNGEYDNLEAGYYLAPDYYNMKSTKDRTIFPEFQPYQQTMADSSGIACALMILNYFGEDVKEEYNELQLLNIYEQLNNEVVYGNGTTKTGLINLFNEVGYTATTDEYLELSSATNDKIADFSDWVWGHLSNGRFIMVRFQDGMDFGWHVIVGLETYGTEYPRDDVLILADPFDNLDHYQDGFHTEALGRFYRWWMNVEDSGVTTDQFDYILVNPKTPIRISRVEEERKQVQTVPELHLLLNPDGSYGGSTDPDKYGTIDIKNGSVDQLTSIYHKFNDYYNMQNTDTRYILTGYRAFQQTMSSSCGICSTLSVLNYYGEDVTVYNEVYLTELYCDVNNKDTIYNVGVGSSGLKKLVAELGYEATAGSFSRDSYVDNSSREFGSYEEFLLWAQTNLSKGTPMPISWRPHSGHWEVIIGIDNMGTDYIYDDVIILADSADNWDHYQDGYNTLPATMFFRQWYNGSLSYNQQFCVFDRIS